MIRPAAPDDAGGPFLIAYAQGDLPAEFALPAASVTCSWGSPLRSSRASSPRRGRSEPRGAVLAWCALGVLDLAVAVAMGFLTSPSEFRQLALGAPNDEITSYPFVLIPAFAVPASALLHIYVIARLVPRRSAAAPSLAA